MTKKKKIKILVSASFVALLTIFLFSKANTSKKLFSPDKQYSVYAQTYVYSELMCAFSFMDCWHDGKVYLYDEKENKILETAYATSIEALESVNWIDHNNTVSFKSDAIEILNDFWLLPRPFLQNKKEIAMDSTVLKSNHPQEKDIVYFENNTDYFIRDIDLNTDGISDKIVSSEKYQGDELYLFANVANDYKLVLKTVNLSEDGGNIIGDISVTNTDDEVFKIHTFFPDGGNLQATHFISFRKNKWFLKRTVYETSNWKENNFTYICDMKQDIPLEELNRSIGFEKFKQIPNEADRDKLCIKKPQTK